MKVHFSLQYRNNFYLYQAAFGELGDGYGGAGGEGGFEEGGVHLIQGSEVRHVGEEDGCLHYMGCVRACCLQDGGYILHRLLCLAAEVRTCEVASLGVNTELSARKEHAVGYYGLAVCAYRCRRIGSVDNHNITDLTPSVSPYKGGGYEGLVLVVR